MLQPPQEMQGKCLGEKTTVVGDTSVFIHEEVVTEVRMLNVITK